MIGAELRITNVRLQSLIVETELVMTNEAIPRAELGDWVSTKLCLKVTENTQKGVGVNNKKRSKAD